MQDVAWGRGVTPGPPALDEAPTSTHWGAYVATARGGRLTGMTPWPGDPDPSPIGASMVGAVQGELRVTRPVARRGWLERTGFHDHGRRGAEPFVELGWDEAMDLVAGELDRVRRNHGNAALYGGSYGWASAGRFHHAPGQLHRFLGCLGGYTGSVGTYSYGAAEVALRHVLGGHDGLTGGHSTWDTIAANTGTVIAFGGLPLRNAQVQAGGASRHEAADAIRRAAAAGTAFVTISPCRDDRPDCVASEWVPLRPTTDVAVMLGLAHVLITEGLIDRWFLDRCCVGFDTVRNYVFGHSDGRPKTPEWASAVADVPAARIVALARRMASTRTLLMVNWAIQRAEHGEQPYWMAVTLACLLGQVGLPGGGFGFGYAATNGAGRPEVGFKWPALPQTGQGGCQAIPVARIADMLLDPGGSLAFDGRTLTYPDIRLVYWAGGNPFHHHQDLNRLVEAWQRPETIVVHEQYWTATARHADIVLPVTTSLERNDVGISNRDSAVIAMKALLAPVGAARDDHTIFRHLARRLGAEAAFSAGRDEAEWLRALYEAARETAGAHGSALPAFEAFWEAGCVELAPNRRSTTLLAAFRADPQRHCLATPSGLIELHSATVAGFGYAECPGHAVWREPVEWLGSPRAERHPLHLLSPQPHDKLHSQYDHGALSRAAKVAGRAPLRIHPQDAADRAVQDGDVVLVSNDRGACLAGAVVTDAVRPGVVQLPTGAWFDPSDPVRPGSLERHGNPNVLTADRGTSRLAQAASCNSTLVEVARYDGPVPPLSVVARPAIQPGCTGP